jgi:hypothetical protein
VTKSDMTARLGEVRKATVHKAQVVEEPRAAHYRNDDWHNQQGWMWTTWELCTLHVNSISTGIIEVTVFPKWFNMFDTFLHQMIPTEWFRQNGSEMVLCMMDRLIHFWVNNLNYDKDNDMRTDNWLSRKEIVSFCKRCVCINLL